MLLSYSGYTSKDYMSKEENAVPLKNTNCPANEDKVVLL